MNEWFIGESMAYPGSWWAMEPYCRLQECRCRRFPTRDEAESFAAEQNTTKEKK